MCHQFQKWWQNQNGVFWPTQAKSGMMSHIKESRFFPRQKVWNEMAGWNEGWGIPTCSRVGCHIAHKNQIDSFTGRFLQSWFKDATKVRFWFLFALFLIFTKLLCCCVKVEGWNQIMSKACEQIWNLVEKRKMSNICLFSPCKIGLTSYWIYRTVWIWEKAAFPVFQTMPCPSFRIWQKFLK